MSRATILNRIVIRTGVSRANVEAVLRQLATELISDLRWNETVRIPLLGLKLRINVETVRGDRKRWKVTCKPVPTYIERVRRTLPPPQ